MQIYHTSIDGFQPHEETQNILSLTVSENDNFGQQQNSLLFSLIYWNFYC